MYPALIFRSTVILTLIICVGCGSKNETVDLIEGEVTPTNFESKPETLAPFETTNTEELAALDKMVDELIPMAKNDSAKVNAKLQVLFTSADGSKKLAPMAQHAAKRIASEAKGTGAAELASSYLILAKLQRKGASDELFQELATFANDYPKSNRPIQLYKQLSDRLMTSGQSKAAIELLDHGIHHCTANRDVEPLKKQKRMTVQTMALMSRPNSTGKPPIKPKKSRTKKNSDYYSFIGKQFRPTGSTLQGSPVSSGQLQGEWVYVHVWATWCGACRSDMPNIVSDRKKVAKYGVKFIGLNLDKDTSKAKKYLKENGISWPQLSGSKAESLATNIGVSSIPICFLIGPDGQIVEAGSSGHVTGGVRYHLKK